MKLSKLLASLVMRVICFCFFFNRAISERQQELITSVNGLLAAFGDFDSDKYTDLFLIHSNLSLFEIYKANAKNPNNFQTQSDLRCDAPPNQHILGVIPADFHGEAMLDVVISTKSVHQSVTDSFKLFLVKGNRTALDCSNLDQNSAFAESRIQPLLLDFNGDMIGDLLIQHANVSCSILMFTEHGLDYVDFPCTNRIRQPNSNAFIDLNLDFIPDIFLEEDDHALYCNLKGGSAQNFKEQSNRLTYPLDWPVRGLSTFFDLNSDGRIEHVFPVCSSFNCEHGQILAWFPSEEKFLNVSAKTSDWTLDGKRWCFTGQQTNGNLIFPFKLRHADVDGDGFIDLITVMHDCDRDSKQNHWIVLHNEELHNDTFSRTFRPKWLLATDLIASNQRETNRLEMQAIFSAFLDIGEDGKPDFILQSKYNGSYKMFIVHNPFMEDACFLKVMVISGRCYDDCGKAVQSKALQNPFTNYNVLGYGTNQAGQSICFELVDSEGHQRQSCAGQMTQSADFALQMPYNVFGIGQLPNFIDTLIASVPIDNTRNSPNLDQLARKQTWTQIVPDSQVVVIPHPPDQPALWRTKLFITPSEYALSTLITLCLIFVILLIIICILYRREKQEDKAEHQEYKRHWPECK